MRTSLFYSIFILLLIACKDDNPSKESSLDVNLDEEVTLSLVNSYRTIGATCGAESKPSVSGLEWDDALAKTALNHSNDMQQNDYFSHTGQNGSTFSERAEAAGFEGFPVGENIASGYADEQAVIDAWMKSEGHCINIMNGNATHIGVARSDEGAVWTMVLGKK